MKVCIQGKHGLKTVNLNRRRAIREKCLNCSSWVVPEVRNCGHATCSLWPFRLGSGQQDPKARSRSIREYCLWCMADQAKGVWQCTATDCPLWPYRKARPEHPRNSGSMPRNHHIQAFPETEKSNACLSMGQV